jgi:DNA-binding Lrp family transcriptional regulator
MTELERKIIGELQHDLPIAANPYAIIAQRIGIAEAELIEHIRGMLERGVIRKVGAVLRHRRVGFKANALCVWQVPQDRMSDVGNMFAALPVVTHCYERSPHPDWAFNLYTMVHALSREECEAHITAMRQMSGIDAYQIFYSTQELKKTSMRYFE